MNNLNKLILTLLVVSGAGCTVAPDGTVTDSLKGDADTKGTGGIVIEQHYINGQVQVGPVRDMEVEAYYYNELDEKVIVGNTKVDTEGRYSIPFELNDQIIYLEAFNGSYQESSSQEWVYLSKSNSLKSILSISGANDEVSNISVYTTLVVGKYEHLLSKGLEKKSSLEFAQNEIGAFLQVDPYTSEVMYPSSVESAEYGIEYSPLNLGTLVTITSDMVGQYNIDLGFPEHSVFTMAKFSKLAYDDVRYDGFLDGYGYRGDGTEAGELYFGSKQVTGDTYRTDVARQTIQFIFSERNKSGIDFFDYRDEATRFSSYKGSLFKALASEPIDPEAPVASWNVTKNEVLHGDKRFLIEMSDNVGIASAVLKIDDYIIETYEYTKSESLDFIWDSSEYPDGIVDMTLTVEDYLGNITELKQPVFNQNVHYFPDVIPEITTLTDNLTNSDSYLFIGNYEDYGAGLEYITVNGAEVQLDEDNNFQYLAALTPGENLITVYARTQFQREKTAVFSIISDQEPAVINWETPGNGYQTYFEVGTTNSVVVLDELKLDGASDLLSIPASHVSLNGLPIKYADLAAENRAMYSFNVSDTDGLSDRSEDVKVSFTHIIDNEQKHTGNLNITENGRYIIPLAEEVVGEKFYYYSPQTIHTLEISITDIVGNITTETVSFRAVTSVGDVSIDAPEPASNSEILTTPFEFRTELHESFSKAVKYPVHNNSDYDIWVKPQKTGIIYRTTRHVSTHIKEHKVNRTVKTQFYAADPADTSQTIEIGSFLTMNGGSNLTETSTGAGLWAGSASDVEACIQQFVDNGMQKFESTPSGVTTEEFIMTDTLQNNSESGYQAIPGFSPAPSQVLEHSTATSKGYALDIMQIDNMDFETIYTPSYGKYCNVPLGQFYYDSRNIYNNDIVSLGISPYGVAQKQIIDEESVPGWPKLTETIATEVESALIGNWKAYDSLDQELGANNGWFKVRAGETVNVYLSIYTPVLGVNDDPYVAEYYQQVSDIKYVYEIDSESLFRFSVDAGDNNVDLLPEVTFPVDNGIQVLEITR